MIVTCCGFFCCLPEPLSFHRVDTVSRVLCFQYDMAPSYRPFCHQMLGVYVSGKVAANYQQIGFTNNLPVSGGLIGPLLDSCLRSLGVVISLGFSPPSGNYFNQIHRTKFLMKLSSTALQTVNNTKCLVKLQRRCYD